MSVPLVTIYIPTKNRRAYLERAINSALHQTYQNIEIIIVDDGSTDDTRAYLETVSGSNGIRVLYNNVSKGACKSRNMAIASARGEFITGLDDDDELLPKHVETLFANYDHKKSFVASSILKRNNKKIKHSLFPTGIGAVTLDQLLHYNVVGNQVFTTTEKLCAIGGFDEALPALQDLDTWIRLTKAFGPGRKLKVATYIQDVGHGSERISTSSEKRQYALEHIVNKYHEHFACDHWKSVELRRKLFKGDLLTIGDVVRLFSRGNARKMLPWFLKQRVLAIKRLYGKAC